MDLTDYLTIREAAAKLGCNPKQIAHLIRIGALQSILRGNARWIPLSAVAAITLRPRGRPKNQPA